VLVQARIGNGRLDFPADHAGDGWAAGAFIEGGLDQITRDDIGRALASKIVGLSFNVTDQSFDLGGATRPQDLDTQLQLLAAYVAHPAFRPQAFERLRAYFISTTAQSEATPSGVLGRALNGLLHGGDPRWSFPTPEQLAAARPDTLKLLLEKPLATAPIEITIVGDVTVEQAIRQVAATFGALPPRPTATKPPIATDVHFPAPLATPKELKHKGRADQAVALIAWPLPDFYANRNQSDILDLADDILQFRLLEAVRIAEGATYSPQGEAIESPVLAGYGFAESLVETPPDKIANFYAHVSTITKAMATAGVTQDELDRARTPRLERQKKDVLTNNYWLRALSGAQADARKLDDIKRGASGYEHVTLADVKQATKTYFRDDKAWKLVVQPTPTN
jgi:zinc protease